MKNIGFEILKALYENQVRDGQIDHQTTFDNFIKDIKPKHLENLKNGKIKFLWAVDHKKSLLENAKIFYESENYELSILLYSTWFEHWINLLTSNMAKRKKLTESEIISLIRCLNWESKYSWLFKLFDLKPLKENHKKQIKELMDLRNNFVHYKWKYLDPDQDIENDHKKALILENFGKTVRYLINYEKRIFKIKKVKMPVAKVS